jgi:hypothetical protein
MAGSNTDGSEPTKVRWRLHCPASSGASASRFRLVPGFTLRQLLVVVILIALLLGIIGISL